MKYLIFQDFAGKPIPFIFPDRVNHADMREQLPYAKVISAGSVRLCDGTFKCSQDDTGLNLSAFSSANDSDIITEAFKVPDPANTIHASACETAGK